MLHYIDHNLEINEFRGNHTDTGDEENPVAEELTQDRDQLELIQYFDSLTIPQLIDYCIRNGLELATVEPGETPPRIYSIDPVD